MRSSLVEPLVVVKGWGHTRLLIITIYLDVDDGLQEVNLGILYAVGEWIARMGIPWIICGDINNSPKEVRALRWLDSIDGEVVAPDEPTHWCSRQAEGTKIDFYIVKRSLVPFTKVFTVDREATPHRPVILQLERPKDIIYEYTLV